MRHDPGRRSRAELSVAEPGRACLVSSASVSSLSSPQPTPSRAPRALLSPARPDRAPAGGGPSWLRSPGPGLPRPHGPAALAAQLLAPLSREPRSPGRPPSLTPRPPQPYPGPSPGTAQTRSNLRGWQRGACIVLEASERGDPERIRARVSGVGVRVPPECLSSPSRTGRSVCSQRFCVRLCLSSVAPGQGFR